MPTLRAGLVGLRRGRAHAQAFQDCDGVELVAVCDIDATLLETIGDQFDVPGRYADYTEMLEREQLDIVSVATAQGLHAPMVIQAAAHRPKAIICEKAMATSMGAADAMLAACERAGAKLIISHQGRQRAAFERARELVAGGAIGAPLIVSVGVQSGGLFNQGSHLLDRALYVLGDPAPLWVLGQVQRETDRYERGDICEDLCMGIVCLEGGARIVFDSDIGPHGELSNRTFIFTGDQGALIMQTDPQGASLEYGVKLISSAQPRLEMAPDEFPDVESNEAMVRELVAWIDGADGHRQDARHTIKSQAIMLGIYESARTHSLVHMPMRTRSSPLQLMVASGDLPVRYPGRYDIRHRSYIPEREVP
jgi:predicted dehydrogenase